MMEETVLTDQSNDYDSFDEQTYDRPAERWAPLGASAASPQPTGGDTVHKSVHDQLHELEQEQDELNSSLLALTSHFAQVQFRLKQIVSAPTDIKEDLLKELEEFAFKGIPDVRGCTVQDAQLMEELSEREHDEKMTQQREKQQELIQQLKSQLEDLEKYAYETGSAESPGTTVQMQKQSVIIEELKDKLDLNLDNFAKLSTEDLKQVVDHAVGQIVNPVKVKEKLVGQLQTQVLDLERFIQFLQGEAPTPGPLGETRCKCNCPVHKFGGGSDNCSDASSHSHDCCTSGHGRRVGGEGSSHISAQEAERNLSVMKRALTLLQIFVVSQFGCGSREFRKNLLKRTTKVNHYGDIRANLELAVDKVLEAGRQIKASQPVVRSLSCANSDEEEDSVFDEYSEAVTLAVRKDLAMALRDLLQHGLMEVGQSTSLVPFIGCFPSKPRPSNKMMHAWDLLLKYYEMKHGKQYNQSPARTLSQAFDIDVGGKAITAKQTMLSCIDTVLASHTPLKRSEDSQFKAFVCLALNERRLVTWLRLVLRTKSLIDFYYQPWSYVTKTGFDDAFQSLERLNSMNFTLPVDLAVRQFKNIKDAF